MNNKAEDPNLWNDSTEAQKLMQAQNKIIKKFPEVLSVLGKSGRADQTTGPWVLTSVRLPASVPTLR